ncbi:MAG: hypothetical protein JJE40_04350 [Vicinamibacteria bacterium]|nr:hypothetical protein [Vicinamibacteria bacterium]
MTRWIAALSLVCLSCAASAHGQTLAVEVGQSVGVSTEDIASVGTQVRVLGEASSGLRFQVEGAWGARSSDDASDVFGTAYPYDGSFQVIEAYGEYFFTPQQWVRSVKGGRYRTPFGISAASDHAYIGFVRPPLIRYGEYYALSSGYLEHGVDVVVGAPRLSVELSLGTPGDVGNAIRRSGVDTVVRAEGTAGSLIVGVSFIDTTPYLPARFATGRARFGGVDARWMGGGVQVRGEWLGGRPFDGTTTTGGYADVIVHRPVMGPVTALVRAERLAYTAPEPFALYSHRYAAAVRVRLWKGLATSVGVSHQGGELTQKRRTAIDVGVTYAARHDF